MENEIHQKNNNTLASLKIKTTKWRNQKTEKTFTNEITQNNILTATSANNLSGKCRNKNYFE